MPLRRFFRITGIIAALFSAAVFLSGCAGEVPVTESVRFALFGNTAPASPFSGFTPALDSVISSIESEKPAVIIHTGDAIYGGSESDGINERDVRRQFKIFFAAMKNFHYAYYTIPGDRDLFNGAASLYMEYSGRKRFYSFNYGSMHFITLDTSAADDNFIDDIQTEWLKKDLENFRGSNAIFVFFHRPFLSTRKKGVIYPVPEGLHKIFTEFRVKAVFSGGDKTYGSSIYDSVRYIQAGCSGYIDEKDNRRTNQYYIVNYLNGEFDIKAGKTGFNRKN